MSRRRRSGRVRIAFDVIERFAADAIKEEALAVVATNWTLSKSSALHRCKDGTYTLCLIWKSETGEQLISTTRGLRLERRANSRARAL